MELGENASTRPVMRSSNLAPVMRAIGVREIAAMLAGDLDHDEVIARASASTRQYAKRQMTWFRNQMGDGWKRLDPTTL